MVPFADDFGNFFDMVSRFVQLEVQLGDMLQIQVLTERTPEVSFGAVQTFDRFPLFLFTAHNADKHLGILEIVAQLDPGNGYEADTGIFQTMLNQFGDFLKEQFLNSL
jgi:hypothetical protein